MTAGTDDCFAAITNSLAIYLAAAFGDTWPDLIHDHTWSADT